MKKVIRKIKRIRRKIIRIKKQYKWNNLKVLKEIIRAKSYGFGFSYYMKNKGFLKTKAQLKTLSRIKNSKSIAIKETMKHGKFSKKEAILKVENAKKLGINYYTYLVNKCWEFTDKEIKEFKKLLEEKAKLAIENREYYTNIVMEKTNWDREKASKMMALARKKGYTDRLYIVKNIYLLSEEELKKLEPCENKYIPLDQKTIDEINENKNKVMEAMNWSESKYRLEFLRANINCGCNKNEYYLYKLYNKSPKKQREFITMDTYFKMETRYCDFNEGYKFFDDKAVFNETFKKYVNRKWFTNDDLTYEKFLENIKGLDTIAYKPINLLQGRGFKKFKVNQSEEANKKVYDYVMSNGKCVIEDFITQHPDTASFNPNSVNSMRIATMNLNGEFKILGAVFRTGVSNDYDNWSAGGIIAGIDTKTGKIETDGSDKKGKKFTKHPNTKVQYKGFQIPCWDKVVEALKEVVNKVDNMPYIGWDIAITKDNKVEIIEGNHNHDITIIQSVYGILENKGNKYVIEPYLYFNEDKKEEKKNKKKNEKCKKAN